MSAPARRLVGHSLSMCLHQVAKGNVRLDEIERIETYSRFDSREALEKMLRVTMRGQLENTHVANALALYDSGRIAQIEGRGSRVHVTGLWTSAQALAA